jgi:acyl phosphate:glycerol-3-phosphate acyltransferase
MLLFFTIIAAILGGYLTGAIPFAVLIARSQGVDIFKAGSGNPGATNVLRVLGKRAGYTCFLLDAGKGIAAVLMARGLGGYLDGDYDSLLKIVALMGAILGHSFSVFLRFRGGKGVATTIGGIFAIMPPVMLVGLVLWLIVFYISGYVSLASIVLGVSLPFAAIFSGRTWLEVLFSLLIAVVIVVRHRSNIQRLIAGTENRAKHKQP